MNIYTLSSVGVNRYIVPLAFLRCKDSKKLSKRSISTRKYTLFSMYLCAATSLVLDSVVSLMEMGCSLKIFG
jgi:hypothetical protein